MKKLLVLVGMLFILTGCTNSNLAKAYNKMQVGDKKINGYTLDLRINGIVDKTRVNEIVRVDNYLGDKYKIMSTKVTFDAERKPTLVETTNYIIDGKKYAINDKEKYVETSSAIKYSDPALYLSGLKTAVVKGEPASEKLGNITYTAYVVEFPKATVEAILKNTVVTGLTVAAKVPGKIYINGDGYVYRVIYTIGEVTINANYFSIDNARDIVLPN